MALVLAMLAPAAACADPVDQTRSSRRAAAAPAPSVTLATFIARHEKRLLADDTDCDGNVSRAEFLAATKAGKGDPARRLAKLDTNGDGMLNKAEIDTVLTRRFKHLDMNSDGLLSADERAAAHARKAKAARDGADA